MNMKNKIIIGLFLFLIIFGLVTRTFNITLFMCIIIGFMLIIKKFFKQNKYDKHKLSIAQDYLEQRYGNKMGKYVLSEAIKYNKRKMQIFILFCMSILMLLMPFTNTISSIPITYENWDSYSVGASSGSGTFFDWERTSGDDFKIVDTTERTVQSPPKCLRVTDDHSGTTDEGWINCSSSAYEYDGIKIYLGLNTYPFNQDHTCQFDFYPDGYSNAEITFRYYFEGGLSTFHVEYYHVTSGWVSLYSSALTGIQSNNAILEIKANASLGGNGCDYSFYFKGAWYNDSSATRRSYSFLDIADLKITSTGVTDTGYIKTYVDDIIKVDSIAGEYGGENWIAFEFIHQTSGTQMSLHGQFSYDYFVGGTTPYPANPLGAYCYSNLWDGDYDINGNWATWSTDGYGHTVYFENVSIDTNGEWCYFNFTGLRGILTLDEEITFIDSYNILYVYPNQKVTIYIASTSEGTTGGYNNCKTGTIYSISDWASICTDKRLYTQGESINIRYKCPLAIQLSNFWLPSRYYYVWLYDVENLGWLFQLTDGGVSADNYDYVEDYECSLDRTYHYLKWNYDPTEVAGYKSVTGGVDHYKAYIGHKGGGLADMDVILVGGLDFFVYYGDYVPMGNFTSVSPDPPELGQKITIGFEVNNNGYITYRNLLSPDDTETEITKFAKFDGIDTTNITLWDFGSYIFRLYVSSGFGMEIVDTYIVNITDINGTYGTFGYGIEFLTSEPSRVIAGYDVLHVNYRSLNENGTIFIKDARGQMTSYGSKVGIKLGYLSIPIPNYAEIGVWNITMIANDTLYSEFSVIAEENNWVEFNKNTYYEYEPFDLRIKHDKKVEIIFYKDDLAVGKNWYLEKNIFPSGIYEVPEAYVSPDIGEWRVELWEVNNFVKIRKLAEDTCRVIDEESELDSNMATNYIDDIDDFWKGIFGIVIVVACTFMPIYVVGKLKGLQFKIDIPPMLYTVCTGIGAVINLILHLWILEYTFFICVMAGFGTFVLYLWGKRSSGE